MNAFSYGFILSLILITSLGPQNLFVLQQGANYPKFRSVLPVVITAALCDTMLIVLGVQGVALVIGKNAVAQRVIFLAGAVLLARIAWLTWRDSTNLDQPDVHAAWSLRRRVGYALTVSLLNPPAVLDTVVTIGSSAQLYQGGQRWAFATACVLASWLWYPSLAFAGRAILGTAYRRMIVNKVAAVVLFVIASYLIRMAFYTPRA